jgi:hypothetical protein
MKATKPAHCTVDDCDKPVEAKGLCVAHYHRQRRHGSTDALPRGGPSSMTYQESMRSRYSRLDACPRCNAMPGNPCREALGFSIARRSLRKPHPGRPEKAAAALTSLSPVLCPPSDEETP